MVGAELTSPSWLWVKGIKETLKQMQLVGVKFSIQNLCQHPPCCAYGVAIGWDYHINFQTNVNAMAG